jgi:hypothetical protein
MRLFQASSLALVLLLASTAHAGLVLSFSASDLDLTVGQIASVDILVTQTDNGDLIDGGDIRVGADGLFLAGMLLESSAPTVVFGAFVTAGPGLVDSTITPSTASALFVESANPLVATFAPNNDPTSLVLGSYNFTALDAGTTALTLADPSVFDDWVFGNDLGGSDAAVFASAQPLVINVTAVPEPSSFTMVASILGIPFFRRRRAMQLVNSSGP